MESQPTKYKIFIAEGDDFSADVIKKLKEKATVDVMSCKQDDLMEIFNSYDVFWFRLGFKIDNTVLNESSRCKIIATPVTGIDHIDEDLCEQLGVQIVCLRGERTFLKEVRATSEMAIGLAMSVMRKIPMAHESVLKGNWQRDWFRGNELYGKTIGIIGYGRLGKIMADYAIAFGMNVLVFEPRDEAKISSNKITFLDSLQGLAMKSEIISLHVNYNNSTHHLIGEDFFKSCNPDSYFINTSRGGIVDESALLKALENKWIKGAALDVLQGEPYITQKHPLVAYANSHSNLIIVPHIGGNTYESFSKTEHFIACKIINHLSKA